jgi:hypothetical protein
MRTCAAAIAGLAVALALAAPAGAATRRQAQALAFAVPIPAVPMRDVVIEHPSRAQARAFGSAPVARYPVNDGAGRSVDVQLSPGCAATCTNPQVIANFLGTLPHGDEMNLLTVVLVNPDLGEMTAYCGSSTALSCYYPSQNRIIASGHDFTDPGDNATRNYVLAHEYGHHVANHRNNAPFANPAIDWGPKNWAGFAGVCQGVRAGRYFPGAQTLPHYYDNPGEAFAESFARTVFPNDPVPWEWPHFPEPRPAAFPAIRRDALDPWNGPDADQRSGRFPKKQKRKRRTKVNRKVKRFDTPRDGDMKLTLNGPDRANLALKLFGSDGRLIAQSDGVGSQEQVSFQICGERHFTAIVRRHSRRRSRFSLNALLP